MILWLSGTVGAATLSVDQLASHCHQLSAGGDGSPHTNVKVGRPSSNATESEYTGNSESHTHNMTNISSGSANSLPPYYVLSYIIRTM